MSAVGYRWPGEERMPDVVLTGDEFTHLLAIEGEIISGGNPTAHEGPVHPLGVRKPGCPICESIQGKAKEFIAECDRRGIR